MLALQSWIQTLNTPVLIIIGLMIFAGFYFGKAMKFIRLPTIIGFMVIGVVLGPSLFNLIDEPAQHGFSFITDIALGFVALSIGLELKLSSLKKLGRGIIVIIFMESFLAFAVVTVGLFLLTGNLPLSLLFGAIAPASAPAGTVAVIQEYRASGSLTKALYAVVGFDDGLGIIIFGFAAAIAKSILVQASGGIEESFFILLLRPLKEIGLSVVVGGIAALLFSLLARRLKNPRDVFILIFALVLISTGICTALGLSLILTTLIFGLIIVN